MGVVIQKRLITIEKGNQNIAQQLVNQSEKSQTPREEHIKILTQS